MRRSANYTPESALEKTPTHFVNIGYLGAIGIMGSIFPPGQMGSGYV